MLMLMLSLALGPVALGHTRLAVAGWIAGIVVFASVVSSDFEPFLRVELALSSTRAGIRPAAAPDRSSPDPPNSSTHFA